MSTFLHGYELKGVKESVANFISNIDPTDTPFTSLTGKAMVQNTLFQWLTDTDGTVLAPTAGIQQGADAVFGTLIEPTMLNSHTQIFAHAAKVDGTAEAMGLYGRGKPMAYQMMKAGRQIKREIETVLLSAQAGSAAGNAVGGKLDGFATTRTGVDSPAIPADNQISATTSGSFAEADLQKLLLRLYTVGSKASVIMFHPKHAADFTTLRDQNVNTAGINIFDGEVSADVNRKVDTYTDPLGQRFKLVPNRYMPENVMYVMDPSMLEQKILRNFHTKDLPANGDYVAKQLIVELGLANKNPASHGILNIGGAAGRTARTTTTKAE